MTDLENAERPKPKRATREHIKPGDYVFLLAKVFEGGSNDGFSIFMGEPGIAVEHGRGPRSITHWDLADTYKADEYVPKDDLTWAKRDAQCATDRLAKVEAAARAFLELNGAAEGADALRLALDPPPPPDDVW